MLCLKEEMSCWFQFIVEMGEFYLDAVLMPVSLFLVVGYHVYLWRSLKNKPGATAMGVQWLERTLVAQGGGGGVGKSMQLVQSLRNNLMIIVLRASISIIISSSVAALTNNAYKASISNGISIGEGLMGKQSSGVFAAKYAAAFVVSVSSFVCSSFGAGFLVDACILVTTATATAQEIPSDHRPTSSHIQRLVHTGFTLAFIGNRLMWLTFPLLLWSLTPVALALSSLALIWGFSAMDFVDNI